MENTVKQFLSEVFGEVRLFQDKENNLWFVAQDIAEILDYGLTTDMTRGLEDEESDMQTLHVRSENGVEQNREMLVINESGLYSIVLSITKRNTERYEKARSFKKWITGTVIPSIRQNGGYIDKQEIMSDEMIMAKALLMANSVIENQKVKILDQENTISLQTPKVEKFDKMYECEKLITPRDIAKDLGLKSAQELNKIMAENKIIYKKQDKKWTVRSEYNWLIEDGYADFHITDYGQELRWLEKGRIWIFDNINTWIAVVVKAS